MFFQFGTQLWTKCFLDVSKPCRNLFCGCITALLVGFKKTFSQKLHLLMSAPSATGLWKMVQGGEEKALWPFALWSFPFNASVHLLSPTDIPKHVNVLSCQQACILELIGLLCEVEAFTVYAVWPKWTLNKWVISWQIFFFLPGGSVLTQESRSLDDLNEKD